MSVIVEIEQLSITTDDEDYYIYSGTKGTLFKANETNASVLVYFDLKRINNTKQLFVAKCVF